MRIINVIGLRLLLIVVLLVLVGCDRDEPWKDPGPRDVFDTFLMHWFRGEAEIAFDYVLPADREALTKSLEEARELPEEQRPEPHEMLVVAEVTNVYDIAKMEVDAPLDKRPADGQKVTLTLHHEDGSNSEAQLVWSDGRWYVDLPLQPSGS